MLFAIYSYDGTAPRSHIANVNGTSIAHAVKSSFPEMRYQAEFRKRGQPRGEIYGGYAGTLVLVRRFNADPAQARN